MIDLLIRRIETAPVPAAVMGIGIPGSGKSTLLGDLARQLGTESVEVDLIRRNLLECNVGSALFEGIRSAVRLQVSAEISRGGVAVIDATNVEHAQRVADIREYRELGALSVGGVWFDVPLEVATERNGPRSGAVTPGTVACMQQILSEQSPGIHEGFDWLVKVG